MGKRIDELPLDDTPIPSPPDGEAIPDLRDQPWFQFIGEIDELLAAGDYVFAEASLQGIRETVESTRRVSDGQRRAIQNIAASRERYSSRRRYDGFRGRNR